MRTEYVFSNEFRYHSTKQFMKLEMQFKAEKIGKKEAKNWRAAALSSGQQNNPLTIENKFPNFTTKFSSSHFDIICFRIRYQKRKSDELFSRNRLEHGAWRTRNGSEPVPCGARIKKLTFSGLAIKKATGQGRKGTEQRSTSSVIFWKINQYI